MENVPGYCPHFKNVHMIFALITYRSQISYDSLLLFSVKHKKYVNTSNDNVVIYYLNVDE